MLQSWELSLQKLWTEINKKLINNLFYMCHGPAFPASSHPLKLAFVNIWDAIEGQGGRGGGRFGETPTFTLQFPQELSSTSRGK